ncbi:zeta toxin family protein [Hydrogenophaga laconesensis]|uniref:ABC-type ATPase n=1 Tax=Hydrogenophaga laconesensis TaxID=1805971 RepID=A0ABU1V4L9_9BURK|nr:AAA family ATPase [Hydrogenophaga laconesensis]MDR7092406.1 putative ABC-type ATPase [Hydrogenophaga laconesensis]
MTRPVFYLLAGPNGAGKSTLYRASLETGLIPAEAPFVNADLHEAAHLQHITQPVRRSQMARQWADAQRTACLAAGESFVSETVFSHPSKLDLLVAARAAGFLVILLIVCVDDPRHLLVRVQQRMLEGGHSVPPERILARYPRTLANLARAIPLADLALLYDTSGPRNRVVQQPRLVARCRAGRVLWKNPVRWPAWARQLLADVPEGPPASAH